MSTEALYKAVALYYNITVEELTKRSCAGEALFHRYYVANYPDWF